MMGNRMDQIWAHRVRKHKAEGDKVWHYPSPPPTLPIGASRAVWHRKGRGGGRSGGLKDLETGQVASRAVPIPGPMADPGTPTAMVDQAAMVDPGTPAAMADQGARAAMANQGARVAMAEQGAWDASMAGSPPKKFLGVTPLLRGALRRRGRSGFWGAGRNQQGLRGAGRDQQGLWGAGRDQQGLWGAGRDQQGLWGAVRDQQVL